MKKAIVKKVNKKKRHDSTYPSNLGKKDFVMDRKSFLNWFNY